MRRSLALAFINSRIYDVVYTAQPTYSTLRTHDSFDLTAMYSVCHSIPVGLDCRCTSNSRVSTWLVAVRRIYPHGLAIRIRRDRAPWRTTNQPILHGVRLAMVPCTVLRV